MGMTEEGFEEGLAWSGRKEMAMVRLAGNHH